MLVDDGLIRDKGTSFDLLLDKKAIRDDFRPPVSSLLGEDAFFDIITQKQVLVSFRKVSVHQRGADREALEGAKELK